jgi:hypothetical protein
MSSTAKSNCAKIKAQEERRPATHGSRDNPAVSVGEQDRHAHVLEHVAGDAAQHHLTQSHAGASDRSPP